jgi:hypothetical protein
MSPQEKLRADILGWGTALVVLASMGVTALGIFYVLHSRT